MISIQNCLNYTSYDLENILNSSYIENSSDNSNYLSNLLKFKVN